MMREVRSGGGIVFRDRAEAGRLVAARLMHLKEAKPVVLALPRGGVAIGCEIAARLAAPLDIVLVRKLGVPWQPELALGAITDGGDPQVLVDERLAAELAIPSEYIRAETARQLAELERRRLVYCADRPPLTITGRTVIVVDDGIATGSTMRVALRAVRRRRPAHLVLAAPVAAAETLLSLAAEADETVCVAAPAALGAIGYCYQDFHQLDDAEVTGLLAAAAHPGSPGA